MNNQEKEDFEDEIKRRRSAAESFPNFVALSASGEFVCTNSSARGIVISRFSYGMRHPLARISSDGVISGNSRFDELSDTEKMDCATIVVQLHNLGIVTLVPKTEEQKLEKVIAGPTK